MKKWILAGIFSVLSLACSGENGSNGKDATVNVDSLANVIRSEITGTLWDSLYAKPYIDTVYNALFKIENGRPVRMTEDRPIALDELAKEVTALNAPVFLVGDGAALCHEYFTAHGIPCVMAPDNLRWQDAWGVAMAAADKTPGNADELLPVYLRLSQAERERQERLSRSVNS